LKFVDSEQIEEEGLGDNFKDVNGILVPGGFGNRGIEGKIKAIRYSREKKVPFLGICLGMQLAVIEFARNVCKLKNSHSTEFDPNTPYPLIALLKEWVDQKNHKTHKRDEQSAKGGTMRLGAYPCKLKKNTRAYDAYKKTEVSERHRHRYEFNNSFRETLSKVGLQFSGIFPEGELVEIIEITSHPWFLACQFHPEFKSRPTHPHPIFKNFIKATL
jgi:CTP synthase